MQKFSSFALTLALLLGGCTSLGDIGLPAMPGAEKTAGEHKLAEGIALYEKGDFNAAIRVLNAAELAQSKRSTRIDANKYLAFSYCVTQRRTLCRRTFDALLRLDADYELKPAEAGHPLWGPVFAQARKAAERRTD